MTTFQVDEDLANLFRETVRKNSKKYIKDELREALENHIMLMKGYVVI